MIDLLVRLILTIAAPADANPAFEEWFHSLRDPRTGGLCCGPADCRNYPVRIGEKHYWVLFDSKWHRVPDEVVSDRDDNPTGDFVTCIQRDSWLNGVHSGPVITCFFRGPWS